MFYSSVDIQAVKRKITEGTIQSIDDLQINLMILGHNATMINKTSNIVSSDAKCFQHTVMDDVTVSSILYNIFIHNTLTI